MIENLWVFSEEDTLVEVLGDGLPFYDAVFTETLNGTDKLEFSIPGDHPGAANVVRGHIVVFRLPEGTYRAFRIKTHRNGFDDSGARYRYFYCEDLAVDELNAAPIIDRRPNNPLDALIGALENSFWRVGQVDSGFPEASTNFYHETAMSCLQKMAETWGGEFRFRIEHDGRRITGRYVDFLRQRGTDNGIRVTVGKNMRTLEGEEDITALATALYGYGRGEEKEDTGGFGRRISFADVEWKVENGDPVDKPLGQEWVGDPEALAVWGLRGGTVHRFDFVVFEDIEDPEELLRLTWEELQKRKAPQVNYKVGMVDLEYTEGRGHEAVRLGDWVTVIDDDFQPALQFKARVIERKIPLRNPEQTELTIGQVVPTLTDIVNRADRNARDAVKIGDSISLLDSTINTLTDELRRTPGVVYISPTDGILVADHLKDQNPTSAIQLKGGMLAIADEWDPVANDFKWRAFGTGSGFTADLITAGTLNASLVQIRSTTSDDEGGKILSLYDGRVTSYFDGQKMIEVGGHQIRIWPYSHDTGGAVPHLGGEIFSVVQDDRTFLAIGGRDIVGIGLIDPAETQVDPLLWLDRVAGYNALAGPRSENTSDLRFLFIDADRRYAFENKGGPGIWMSRGDLSGEQVADVEINIGDEDRSSEVGAFRLFQSLPGGGWRLLAEVSNKDVYFPLQNTEDGILWLDNEASIRRTGTHLQIRARPNNYITINKNTGAIGFVMGGVQVFTFRPDGTVNTSSSTMNIQQEATASDEQPRERETSPRRVRRLKEGAIYTAPELKRRAKSGKETGRNDHLGDSE